MTDAKIEEFYNPVGCYQGKVKRLPEPEQGLRYINTGASPRANRKEVGKLSRGLIRVLKKMQKVVK